ncbi:MAG: DegV family protein [Aggregatilineales bacterium]
MPPTPSPSGRVPVKIVVDSATDLPQEWIKRFDIGVIPAYVNFGEESFPDDGVALTRAEFYRRLASAPELPGTSAPPPAMAEQVIADQLAKADRVIAFTLATPFSSLHNAIRVAAERVDAARVTVIDSGTVSMAEGWQALAAAESAARGEDYDLVLAAAHRTRARTRLLAVIDTLEYLRRGGRVNWAMANVGALLQIKPIFEVHDGGQVEIIGRVRTMHKGMQALMDLIRSQAPFERVAILHSNHPTGAEALRQQLADILPSGERRFMIGDVATAIGTHVGPGCVGAALVKQLS